MIEFTVCENGPGHWSTRKTCENFDCGRRVMGKPVLISHTALGAKVLCSPCGIRELALSIGELSTMIAKLESK